MTIIMNKKQSLQSIHYRCSLDLLLIIIFTNVIICSIIQQPKYYTWAVLASSSASSSLTTSSLSTTSKMREGGSSLNGLNDDDDEYHDNNKEKGIIMKRIYAQIIHRHGDRSPITPLQNEVYWKEQLMDDTTKNKIAKGTKLVVIDEDTNNEHDIVPMNNHPATGRGPFGKLTTLGLYQMVQVGIQIRNEYLLPETLDSSNEDQDSSSESIMDTNGRTFYPYILNNNNKKSNTLQPSDVQVLSTNFERTIQSVQGLLIGLFDNDNDKNNNNDNDSATTCTDSNTIIKIDVSNTNIMIPDPTPRRSTEQAALEKVLIQRPYIQDRDDELLPLAIRVTKALHPLLASDAHEAEFGIPQDKKQLSSTTSTEDESIEIEPLSWNQLAEVTKCLRVRNLLPDGITIDDCDIISNHAAWKWFQSWRNPRLAYLSMNPLVTKQIQCMKFFIQNRNNSPPCLTIWSGHDSTLIGLLCAYHLEQPAVWPEYASYFVIELLEVQDNELTDYYVRFSLNGQILLSKWDNDDEGETKEMILLSELEQRLQTVGATPITDIDNNILITT